MAQTIPREVLEVVEMALSRDLAEFAAAARAASVRVIAQTATGTSHIDQTFSLQRCARLVFVRCHFAGSAGKAQMTLAVDSAQGGAYDSTLYTLRSVGVGTDVNFRILTHESAMPSPWSLQIGDAFRIQWTNPDPGNITWGLEVGLAPAE